MSSSFPTFANAMNTASDEIGMTLGWNSMSAFGSVIPQSQTALDELVEFSRSAPKKGLVSSLTSFWNSTASQATSSHGAIAWA